MILSSSKYLFPRNCSVFINFVCATAISPSVISMEPDMLYYTKIALVSTKKTKLKKEFGKQKQAVRIIFNQDRFTLLHPLLKTLKALNICQINLLQVLLFMHKIKTNSSPRILLHQFQAINQKYAT